MRVFLPLILLFTIDSYAHAAKITMGKDAQAKLPYWQVKDKGMSLRLVQRLPDMFRGFFLGRGFDVKMTEVLVRECAFQTVFKNTSNTSSPSPLRYDLDQWVVYYQGKKLRMKTREYWKRKLAKSTVSGSAKTALHWALYPTVQQYQPGDYNWGISMFGLRPGKRFDLEIYWEQHGKKHRALIKNMQCGPDVHPDPEKFYTQ
jgi:hypothetical protein